jgi:saccharopine dehydrogenase-like NADP-dependent oxidoreductase
MQTILLFGAGKSASVLIDYLLRESAAGGWQLTVVDADLALAQSKINGHPAGRALSCDIREEGRRYDLIHEASLVISLLPPALHYPIACDCLKIGRHLLTASYVDGPMQELAAEAKAKGLLFLCEMGLDPGIDHMSAKKLLDHIAAAGGTVTSFLSHCGGLVAPESDDNPWHYKISWNPRNVVMAGKAGALFVQDGAEAALPYDKLFAEKRFVEVPGLETLCWYPNRDSRPYRDLYNLPDCPTFIRTTLRHPDFIFGWQNLIDLKLTDETSFYESDGKSLGRLFHEHMERHGFSDWLQQKLQDQFQFTRQAMEDLLKLVELEEDRKQQGTEKVSDFMVVEEDGQLKSMDMDEEKLNAALLVANRMHDSKLTLRQLFFLGMDDQQTMVNRGRISAADLLQFALEQKLTLRESDRDMVVMLHEIEYRVGEKAYRLTSTLVQKGTDSLHTAMARTVGLPLGIAARLLLQGKLSERGLVLPLLPSIYEPVLAELEALGIVFRENLQEL